MKREINDGDSSSKMLQTLGVFFFAILLRDYATGGIEWYWVIPMAVIIICFVFVNAMMVFQQKIRQDES